MQYLLDVYIFPQEDLTLNSEVLLWPQTINPIYERNDEVSAAMSFKCKTTMRDRGIYFQTPV